ncbi:MAG: hypothetical protein R3D68_06995 [Hyphomicrobiaceae bacterium]
MNSELNALMGVIEAYKVRETETRVLGTTPHRDLVDLVKIFLFHHGPFVGRGGWSTTTQGLQDAGADAIHIGGAHSLRLGIQVKSHGDFERSGAATSFRQHVLAQIQESRAYKIDNLLLVLGADLTNKSHLEKCRGLLAELHRQNDPYVGPIEPEATAGLWMWRQHANLSAMDQMFDAGYAYLTTIYDNLGNVNSNSWGKGTGGNWSQLRKSTLRVGDFVNLKAIACSQNGQETEYRFSVQPAGGSFDVRQAWGAGGEWTWAITERDIGKHVVVMISVRARKSHYQFGEFNGDDYTYATYDILPAVRK